MYYGLFAPLIIPVICLYRCYSHPSDCDSSHLSPPARLSHYAGPRGWFVVYLLFAFVVCVCLYLLSAYVCICIVHISVLCTIRMLEFSAQSALWFVGTGNYLCIYVIDSFDDCNFIYMLLQHHPKLKVSTFVVLSCYCHFCSLFYLLSIFSHLTSVNANATKTRVT